MVVLFIVYWQAYQYIQPIFRNCKSIHFVKDQSPHSTHVHARAHVHTHTHTHTQSVIALLIYVSIKLVF